jgi:DnaJ-domain-containing protein 1
MFFNKKKFQDEIEALKSQRGRVQRRYDTDTAKSNSKSSQREY